MQGERNSDDRGVRSWRCGVRGVTGSLLILIAAVAAATMGPSAHAEERSFALADAAELGTFGVGAAKAAVTRSFDAAAGREVMKLDYAIPPATSAGIWAKRYPEQFRAGGIDVVRAAATIPPGQAGSIALALELKGSAGTQRIALDPRGERALFESPIDWPTIGNLEEVVLAVSRIGDGEPAKGQVSLDIRFDRIALARKLSSWPGARLAGVLLLSVLGAVATGAMCQSSRLCKRWGIGKPGLLPTESAFRTAVWLRGVKRDFVWAVAIVVIAGLAIAVYSAGAKSGWDIGWTSLAVAAAGAVVAEWLKLGLTGKHLTPGEVFRDMLASGMMAASASSLVVLQAPGAWSDVLLLSCTTAAIAVAVYHVVNGYWLASSGRHLGVVGGLGIVATPYLVGGLLTLGSTTLVESLGRGLTLGVLAASPAMLQAVGRVLVVFLFNEAAAAGLGLVTKRRLLTSPQAHLWLLGTAMAVVAGPSIAAWGSGAAVASLPSGLRLIASVAATMLSQAGLWAQVYLVTGMILEAIHGKAPSLKSASSLPLQGMKKGMIFSGVFMAILYGIDLIWRTPGVAELVGRHPMVVAALFGALAFPLAKTIFESFDGSQAFLRRLRKSYANPTLYLRGVVVGCGLAYGVVHAMAQQEMLPRVWFGFVVGVTAFAGVNALRDSFYGATGRGRPRSWRVYLVDAVLGGFLGAAIGFYLDAAQVAVVADKFQRYVAVGQTPETYGVYPFLSKWGYLNLGTVTGGASLLFAEALAGVISWSIPAWLFAINRTVMTAYFRKETAPIKALFTKDGLVDVVSNMIGVLRWGLWMSPIINSFLRPMGEPTWYNQDGAVRTLIAIFQDATLSPEAFRSWSLHVFVYLLAYDLVRVLIWVDHMGLRVATLVNLSFLGMDRLDQRLARFLGSAATARHIPEGVKRFTTWAPLLIPFYIPRGQDWDQAWSQAEAIQRASQGRGLVATLVSLPPVGQLLLAAGAVVTLTAVFSAIRWLRHRSAAASGRTWTLANTEYEVVLRDNGEVYSRTLEKGYDVSRRSYDVLDPAGRTLFLVDAAESADSPGRAWPVMGNYPRSRAAAPRIEQGDGLLKIAHTERGIRTTVEIALPDESDPVELWTVTVENLTDAERTLKLVPYLEWVLNRPDADRGHTQYNRLFAEMEYVEALNAVLAWDKHSKAQGLLAADRAPEGFLTSRIDFIGRARSLWTSRALETLPFSPAEDTEAHPTFDPIGSLLAGLTLGPQGLTRVRLLIGLTKDKKQAVELIARHLGIPGASDVPASRKRKTYHPIGHGEIPPGTPQPYSEFSADGRTLHVRTPFTPRPYDHTMSNRLGHVVSVTNRGLHTTSSGNSQQNRVTPDWPDIVTREVPGEAFYLYDPDADRWYSPTYHPRNDRDARHEVDFGVDGTATYRMSRDTLATELTVFVPPDDPAGVYLLTVRNHGDAARRIRVAPYFQIVLANQPEHAGPLRIRRDDALGAVFFENPRNTFRTGPAFAALSCPAERVETRRGRFFGPACDAARPAMVERGEADRASTGDDRPIAGLLTTLEIPAGEERTVAVVLGQADSRGQAEAVIRKFRDLDAVRASLDQTRQWWLSLMETVRVETSDRTLDQFLDWLKYQALAERIWARRGYYQASGAYGFRDQLQDSVNLMWMDPALARRQIVLHASQQFLEGDVVHWFHLLQDGRTGFAARTHASDNLLWLAWATAEYVHATGDESLLDEQTPYLEAEQPFAPLPAGKHGMGFEPLRSSRTDSIYRHCLRAIDLVLDHRMGAHGLPLMGAGDWNDGLDEIGSQGKGESVWLGFFLAALLDRMAPIIARRESKDRQAHYLHRTAQLKDALELTWRDDRYLRAIHDDGTEIGVKGSGVWEIDALTAAWAVMADVDLQRARMVFDTAVRTLEQPTTILLGWPALREDTRPYLGRSSWYPEGVRENGMYSHGVQWLVGAARRLADQCQRAGEVDAARRYRETAHRLWHKIAPMAHCEPGEIETYGGQPNKQAADMVTTFDPGRMIWHGYTGAAGWMFRQALEGVIGARLVEGAVAPPADPMPATELTLNRIFRDVTGSPLEAPAGLRKPAQEVVSQPQTRAA